jgi:hypothetical protein
VYFDPDKQTRVRKVVQKVCLFVIRDVFSK